MTSLLLAPSPVSPAPRAVSPARAARSAGRPPVRDRWTPAVVGLLVAAAWTVVALRIFARMGSGMDLAIFDQGVRSLSHLHAPTSAMKSAGMNLWGDHFHPVLVLIAPLYWLWDDPRTLLLAQAAATGLGCAILIRSALDELRGRWRVALAVLMGLALAVSPGVQSALLFDVHEVAFGVPLLAMALRRFLQGRWTAFGLWSLSLLLVKEDMGLLVVGLGMVAFLRGLRRWGMALLAVGIAWTAVVVKVVIPGLSPSGAWLYAGSVSSPAMMLQHVVDAVTSGRLPLMLVVLALGAGGLALGSPLVLALVPGLLARAASGNPVYVGLAFHYNLLAAVVLAFALLDVVRRPRLAHRAGRCLVVLLVVVTLAGLTACSCHDDVTARVAPSRIAAAHRALDVVPDGAPVAADVFLTPQLTRRHPITQQVRPSGLPGHVDYRDDLGRPLAAQWIVLDRFTPSQGGPAWVGAAVAHFTSLGWVVVRDDGGFVVLRR